MFDSFLRAREDDRLAQRVRIDDNYDLGSGCTHTCRSSTFQLKSGRHLGFAIVSKSSPALASDNGNFNRLPGLASLAKVDTAPFTKPLLVIDGLPGGRLLARAPALQQWLATGTFDCIVGVDRPGSGLSDVDAALSPVSVGRDVSELIDALWPRDGPGATVRLGVMGASAGGPMLAGVATNEALRPRIRGVLTVSAAAMMRDASGSTNANWAAFLASGNPVAPFLRRALRWSVGSLATWTLATLSPWSNSQALAALDKMAAEARARGEGPAELEARQAAHLGRFVPFAPADVQWLCAAGGSNFRHVALSQRAVFALHGGRGVLGECGVLASHWAGIDWESARTLRWGVVHGLEDRNVPPEHGRWWVAQLGDAAEPLFLAGHGHMSSFSTEETLALGRRVFR